MENTVKQRIILFIKRNKLSQKKFEQAAGLSNGYINSLRNCPSISKIQSILEAFPELNKNWLLTGEGEMLNSSSVASTPTAGEGPADGLPLIPVDAMAGALSGTSYEPISRYDCEDIYNVPAFRGAEFLIRVQGDSMQPKYMSGDIIACRRVPLSRLWFQWGKAYVLDTQQGAIVKRIEPSRKKGCISACSENPKYKPFDLSVEEINGIAIVLGTIRAE